MMHRIILTVSLLSSLALPLSAHAYATPEEILDEGDFSTRFVDPPPSRRSIADIKEEETQKTAERRKAEQAAVTGNGLPEEQENANAGDEDLHEAAPAEGGSQLDAIMGAIEELKQEGKTADELRDERVLERIKLQQEQSRVRTELPLEIQRLMNGDALHSGAPLSDTGMGTIVAIIAMVGTTVFVLRRVRKMEKIAG